MKATLRALAALLLATLTLPAAAQSKKPAPTAAPPTVGGAVVGESPKPPAGAVPAQIQEPRLLDGQKAQDPWQMERLGVAAVQKNELARARDFFEESWRLGELPTAPYNLACLDAREGKADAAFRQLERAVAAGFDDEVTLGKDSDLASLRGRPEFAKIVEGVKKNRVAGDEAVIKEGIFLPPPGAKPKAILVLLHEVNSDPMTIAGPFLNEARAKGLYVAAPRGPSRSGKKRFGWGSPDRALEAFKKTVAEAGSRVGNVPLPVLVAGAGRGGKLGIEVVARSPGLFGGVASVGGSFDPAEGGAAAVAGLKRIPVFLGISKGAPPELARSMQRGRQRLEKLGVKTTWAEWPGTGEGMPTNAAQAAKEILGVLAPR